MTGTLINESNSGKFLGAVPEGILSVSDLAIGVYDEESSTACGVLCAEAIGMHTLDIIYIYVAEGWRLKGAGKELVNTFIEAAKEMEASEIIFSYSRENLIDGMPELIESCGFVRNEEETKTTYGVTLNELSISGNVEKEIKAVGVTVLPLSEIDDKKWQLGSINWKKYDGPPSGTRAFKRKKDSYEQDLSFVLLDKNQDIVGLLLGIRSGQEYEVRTLSALGKYASNVLYAIIDQAIIAGRKIMGKDAMIIVKPEHQQSMELLEHISSGEYLRLDEDVQYKYML